MSDLRIANRYAEALMITAEDSRVLKKISDDFILLWKIINESNEFKLFLKSPVIKKDKKQEVFKSMFGGMIHPLTLQFLCFLSDKRRENVLLDTIDAFFHLLDDRSGIVDVHITAASKLTEQQFARFEKRFAELSKKKVRLRVDVDSQLLGGFIARMGDTMYDGSVKRQLELLHHRFVEELAMKE